MVADIEPLAVALKDPEGEPLADSVELTVPLAELDALGRDVNDGLEDREGDGVALIDLDIVSETDPLTVALTDPDNEALADTVELPVAVTEMDIVADSDPLAVALTDPDPAPDPEAVGDRLELTEEL